MHPKYRRHLQMGFALLLAATVLASTAPSAVPAELAAPYVLETRPSQEIRGVAKYEILAPTLRASEWVVFAAEAPELSGQTRVRSTLSHPAERILEKQPPERPLLRARVPATTGELERGIQFEIVYEAELRSRHLRARRPDERIPAVASLSVAEKKLALDAHGDCDFLSPAFEKWQAEHSLERPASESDLDFARRVFLAVRRNIVYEYVPNSSRQASQVCAAGKSDCGGMANLFVAALRRGNVPARALVGRWAQSAKASEAINGIRTYQWHVKAEFFAQGVGWVPADLSSAVLHDKSPEGLRYFGHDEGDFLVQHVDCQIALDTVHFGEKSVLSLQQPAWWVTGQGKYENVTVNQSWQVTARR